MFDYGGVVTGGRSESFGLYSLSKEFANYLKKPVLLVYKIFIKKWDNWKVDKIRLKDVFDYMSKKLKLNNDQIRNLKRIMFSHTSLDKETVRLIKNLKKNYKVVCFTNHGREWFSNDKKRFKLNNLFDRIFTSYELKIAKPHKRSYLKVLKELKVKPEEVVYVDDLKRNIMAAKALKMNTFLFKGNLNKFKKYLKRLNIEV